MHVDFLDSEQAENFVKRSFADLPARLRHVLVVSDMVRQTCRDIKEHHPSIELDESLAYCAALVHDIGYLESIAETGFHPLDGANFLEHQGFSILADLIIGHSSSPEEAQLRGIDRPIPCNSLFTKVLTFWDMQVGPGGVYMSYAERCQDILFRYSEDSVVGKANIMARPRIEEIIKEIELLRIGAN